MATSLVAYVGLEWISFIHEYKGLPITPWNPGLGVAFALVLARGAFFAAVLFIGVILAELLVLRTNLDPVAVIGIAGIITAVYGGTATGLRRFKHLDASIPELKDLAMVLSGGLFGAFIVSLVLPTLLVLDDQLDWADAEIAALPLFLGDIIGIAVMTPLTLRFLHLWQRPIRPAFLGPEILLHAGFILVIISVIVSFGFEGRSRYFYLLFLPVVVAAVRYGLDGACLSLALTQFALVGGLHISRAGADAFTEFQTLMIVLTTTGLTVGVVVSERQRANDRTRTAEARLRDMEAEAGQAGRFHLVSGMASALAHEINQPMTAARAFARSANHILVQPEPDLDRAASNLSQAIAQIDHAGGVLRRMREFLRRGQPHFSPVIIQPMLEDALTLIRADAETKQVSLKLDVPGELPVVAGDRVQIQQVLLNLVRNAIDSIAGGPIGSGVVRIVVRPLINPPRVEFAVWDDGPGISDELATKLFEPLTTSKNEGLGLGLPICVSIIEAHGGRLWLRSHGSGNTEFRFTLPLDHLENNQ